MLQLSGRLGTVFWWTVVSLMFFLQGCSSATTPVVPALTNNNADLEGASLELVEPLHVLDVEPNAFQSIQVVVRNSGTVPLDHVSPKLSCNCNLLHGLPETLLVGESGTVEFKILSPFAGSHARRIDFLDGTGIHVGSVNITLKASGDVPRVVDSGRIVSIRHVAGEDQTHGLEVETVEESSGTPFITEAESEDATLLSLGQAVVRDTKSADQHFVRRNYRFPVTVLQNSPGDWETGVKVKSSQTGVLARLAVSLHVLPRVLMVPNELKLQSSAFSADDDAITFRLIPRVPAETYEVEAFDENLVKVQRTSEGTMQQWEVRPASHDAVGDTKIRLRASSGHEVELPVSIQK